MKILFVVENHYPKIGGVETLFKDLTESLANKGHTITVLTNKSPSDNLPSRESYMPNLTIIRKNFFNRYIFTFFAWIPAFFLARKHDIIHTTSYNAGLPSYIAGLLTGKKVIITFHEVWGKMWFTLPHFGKISLYFHYIFEQLLLKLGFHKFIAVSQFTADSLSANGVSQDRIAMIYNGLDYSEFENIEKEASANETFTFLYYGRLGISKGLDILIDGAALLKKDFKLKIIVPRQPATLLKDLQRRIEDNGLENLVQLYHELAFDVLKAKVSSADAVIIPSYSEGFCFAAAETMAVETPIISSGKGALKEVVNGKFVEMKEFSVEGLYHALLASANDNWSIKQKEKFPLEDTIDAYLRIYETIKVSN